MWSDKPCKLTTKMLGTKGYGKLNKKDSGHWSTHRAAYANANNNYVFKPEECVLHHCDNRACIEITHLFLGTRADNNIDRSNKDRTAKGSKSGNSALTETQVLEIKYSYIPRIYTVKMLSKKYHVTESCIRHILSGRSWEHIK